MTRFCSEDKTPNPGVCCSFPMLPSSLVHWQRSSGVVGALGPLLISPNTGPARVCASETFSDFVLCSLVVWLWCNLLSCFFCNVFCEFLMCHSISKTTENTSVCVEFSSFEWFPGALARLFTRCTWQS